MMLTLSLFLLHVTIYVNRLKSVYLGLDAANTFDNFLRLPCVRTRSKCIKPSLKGFGCKMTQLWCRIGINPPEKFIEERLKDPHLSWRQMEIMWDTLKLLNSVDQNRVVLKDPDRSEFWSLCVCVRLSGCSVTPGCGFSHHVDISATVSRVPSSTLQSEQIKEPTWMVDTLQC